MSHDTDKPDHKVTKLDHEEINKLVGTLDDEAKDPTYLSDVEHTVFGNGASSARLLTDAKKATTHVNDTLKSINDGFAKYSQAFHGAAKGIQETSDQTTADAKLLTAGLGMVQTPFYGNKGHGKPKQPLPPPHKIPEF